MIVSVRCNKCLNIWIMKLDEDVAICCPYCTSIDSVSIRGNNYTWWDAVCEFAEEEREGISDK